MSAMKRESTEDFPSSTVSEQSIRVDFPSIDPFGPRKKLIPSLTEALLATALFRCWHILIFFAGWSTAICVISERVYDLGIQSTLLTVFGTVLGFVISYRTTSSFERYNEGRRYWSQIVLASRTLGRAIWFQLPEIPASKAPEDKDRTEEERRARTLIEKKAFVNLIEAFAVSLKHYLRGEEGIYYADLYHLVKFLPSYSLPAGLPSHSNVNLSSSANRHSNRHDITITIEEAPTSNLGIDTLDIESGLGHAALRRSTSTASRISHVSHMLPSPSQGPRSKMQSFLSPFDEKKGIVDVEGEDVEMYLQPSRMPPKYHLFDFFPFSMLVKFFERRGWRLKGKKAARFRARQEQKMATITTHNIPLEITLYMTSYLAALAARESIGVPMHNLLISSIGQLTDALTGLERILTTPIPFSYSMHLWLVTMFYCMALPFQIWPTLRWITIPATIIASFIFFGFLVAGEEIENPFGYDKNDLNMDHFTDGIIRRELAAMTARPPPKVTEWAFTNMNDRLFPTPPVGKENKPEKVTPQEWVQRGSGQIQVALAMYQ